MVEPMTLREIAETEGISHQAVAEILQRALIKFHKALAKRGIKIEDLL
jgi:predicted DNA binding protein